MSFIVTDDTNHVQPFIILTKPDGSLHLYIIMALITQTFPIPIMGDSFQYWSKYTITYRTNGIVSLLSFYLNGTFIANSTGAGSALRFGDNGLLTLGGYNLAPTSLSASNRFLGWMDDLAFYNRVLTPKEIASTWNMPGNVSDHSMVLYYNFDQGPNNGNTILNLGYAGSQGNLINGEVLGANIYIEIDTSVSRSVAKASWVRFFFVFCFVSLVCSVLIFFC